MLPKVATHIVHSASRAAASIHQAHTIRNVFQLQHTSGPSNTLAPWNTPGSSNWGNNGPSGAGSTKHNPGSRFHYTNAGRAVTVANSSLSASDGLFSQNDETEDAVLQPTPALRPVKTSIRARSRSVSLSVQDRNDRAEKLGILKTVQLHAQSRHAFATVASAHLPQPSSEEIPVTNVEQPATRPFLVRRNSTSAPSLPNDVFDHIFPAPPVPRTAIRRNSTASSHPASPTVLEVDPSRLSNPLLPSSAPDTITPQTIQSPDNRDRATEDSINLFQGIHDFNEAAAAVQRFLQETSLPSIHQYNSALHALHTTRQAGESIQFLIEVYNHMLDRSISPVPLTYIIMIEAMTARDVEIQESVNALRGKANRSSIQARRENHFRSAMAMFSTLIAIDGNEWCRPATYRGLLQSSAARGNVAAALRVFSEMEKRNRKNGKSPIPPSPIVYKHLILAHTNGGKLDGAQDMFQAYQTKCEQGGIYTDHDNPSQTRDEHVKVWNQMIDAYFRFNLPEKAVGLVERMLNSQGGNSANLVVPPISSSIFTTVLAGFCRLGDLATAMAWFDRLLEQNVTENDSTSAFSHPMRPQPAAWAVMFDALASHGMIKDVIRLFLLRTQQNLEETEPSGVAVFTAILNNLTALPATEVQPTLDFLLHDVAGQDPDLFYLIPELWKSCISHEMYGPAVYLLDHLVNADLSMITELSARDMHLSFCIRVYDELQGRIPYAVTLRLARLAERLRVTQQEQHIPVFLHSYGLSRSAGDLPLDDMTLRDWELLLYAALAVESSTAQGGPMNHYLSRIEGYAFDGLLSLLGDLRNFGVAFEHLNVELVHQIVNGLQRQHTYEDFQTICHELGPVFQTGLGNAPALEKATSESSNDSGYYSSQDQNSDAKVRIDQRLTKAIIRELWATTPTQGVPSAYALFRDGIQNGVVPTVPTLGHLIQNLGRRHMMNELHYTYSVAQSVLRLLESKESLQRESWLHIEDSMIIALAHHGNIDGAHIHRMRILEYGGVPSADAYGALIYHVKDTTDDSSNALALFAESQRLGVPPNQYLYNNIISKLSKARKADYALELFQQMKANGVQPTSVTYGAVIGACARVGDTQFAESLFSEMVASKTFKPRVPPYNTMMQLYTTTKPNRDRALYYYNELLGANIRPSGHTYKLLLDAYGAIEPLNIQGMERVFAELRRDPKVTIQGTHFASMINAYGCVQKNLPQAIEVFNSIYSCPGAQPPDAVVFEAVINALVANRQTDLIPEWMEKMDAAGVHMTAYVANVLIRGHSMVGDIEKARAVFESLQDPPEGVAAPYNHVPHDFSNLSAVDCSEPVYREPSTWEVMVRAELGSGNRQGALDLLERLKTRQYPEAVYNRISGIMVDHSLIVS